MKIRLLVECNDRIAFFVLFFFVFSSSYHIEDLMRETEIASYDVFMLACI